MIRFENVYKAFGDTVVLDDFSLDVPSEQTTVIIGGEQVPAYGTACLQPDGAWRRGPATAVPQ